MYVHGHSGRVLTLVSLIVTHAFSFNCLSLSLPPPATLAVRGEVLDSGLPYHGVLRVPSINFLHVFPGFIA